VAVVNRRDEAYELANDVVGELGRNLVVPITVLVEVDQLLRDRVGSHAARAFLRALVAGEHAIAFLTAGLLRRAIELDSQYADLELGIADASVMAIAEQERLQILTFDFTHFRATRPARGFWRLVVDEARYTAATGG
jgi:predicted nucleic acid-binding protein